MGRFDLNAVGRRFQSHVFMRRYERLKYTPSVLDWEVPRRAPLGARSDTGTDTAETPVETKHRIAA